MKLNGNHSQSPLSPKHFYVIGLNYKKADADIRGRFSISEDAKIKLLERARESGITSITCVSTCNRTEVYGRADHPFQLIKLLCAHTAGTIEDFEQVAYIHKNVAAVNHIFRVGTGLDSQILGDFEIISQLRSSFKLSKKMEVMDHYLERLANAVIRASKRIKNETSISSGAASISFSAVQFIMDNVSQISEKNILLFGLGKIGHNTCENLVKHSKNKHITLINRTLGRAERIGGKFKLIVKEIDFISEEISNSDVLIVATGAEKPTITNAMLDLHKPLLVLDLSIPRNVSEDVENNDLVTLVHLDDLASRIDKTLDARANDIPAAKKIISEVQDEFNLWAEQRKYAPTINALKDKLISIKENEINFQRKKLNDFNEEQAEILSDRIIHKITTHFANHLKDDPMASDESLEIIKKVFQLKDIH